MQRHEAFHAATFVTTAAMPPIFLDRADWGFVAGADRGTPDSANCSEGVGHPCGLPLFCCWLS